MGIADNIKRLREDHGLTQEEFAAQIGVSGKAVCTWENGTRVPRLGAIEKIAAFYGIRKSDIIEDSEYHAEKFSEKKALMNALFDQLTPDQQNQVIVDLLSQARGQLGLDSHK